MRTKRAKLLTTTAAVAPPSDPKTEALIVPNVKPDAEKPDGDDDKSELVRVSEAAHTLRVSENSIRAYVKQGLLDQVRIGTRTVRIKGPSLKRLMGQAAE